MKQINEYRLGCNTHDCTDVSVARLLQVQLCSWNVDAQPLLDSVTASERAVHSSAFAGVRLQLYQEFVLCSRMLRSTSGGMFIHVD